MLLLVSGASKYPRSADVGHLIVPRAGNARTALNLQPRRWAGDNDAFIKFDSARFIRMLERFQGAPECLFISAPDAVGDAAATLRLWPFWSKLIRGLGFPPAFVAQDGLLPHQVPWNEMGALFIGGTTTFKEGSLARTLCAYASARGIWIHWGRVNSQRRYALAMQAGCDSIDGTGFSRYPDINIPKARKWKSAVIAQRTETRARHNAHVEDPFGDVR